MAGLGASPKAPGQRRRYNQPARGEWVDLQPLERPLLPHADRGWSKNAKRAWASWRNDPVTSQWGPADREWARELARLYDELAPTEVRLRLDGLGLTPKGKRDLRWRTPAEVKTIAEQPKVKRLQLVAQPDRNAADAAGG